MVESPVQIQHCLITIRQEQRAPDPNIKQPILDAHILNQSSTHVCSVLPCSKAVCSTLSKSQENERKQMNGALVDVAVWGVLEDSWWEMEPHEPIRSIQVAWPRGDTHRAVDCQWVPSPLLRITSGLKEVDQKQRRGSWWCPRKTWLHSKAFSYRSLLHVTGNVLKRTYSWPIREMKCRRELHVMLLWHIYFLENRISTQGYNNSLDLNRWNRIDINTFLVQASFSELSSPCEVISKLIKNVSV